MTDASEGGPEGFEIVEYCNRLSCHKPIVQLTGRGRRREFCSETCRRAGDRDYKRAKALVEHFEVSLRKTRHEVAAYGRKAEADGGFLTPEERAHLESTALAAVSRAEAVVEYAGEGDDRYLGELRRLLDAVRPVVGSAAPGAASRVS